MRKMLDNQLKLGEIDISKIELDINSRDEIPQLLMGLKHLYCNTETREKIFKLLEDNIAFSFKNGRPGMSLWQILVLGTIRLNCNWDYDKLKEMADNHLKLREMLGHTPYFDTTSYAIRTLRDNLALFTPELLMKINSEIVVPAAHDVVKKEGEALICRCDSFVVETDVHYPTNINLIWDCVRKVILLTAKLASMYGLSGWREYKSNLKKIKKMYTKISKMKASNAKDDVKRQKRQNEIHQAYIDYMACCKILFDKAQATIIDFQDRHIGEIYNTSEIASFISHGLRQINEVERRILNGETAAHEEKIFSVFEEHTEWISKGKAGVPQELGMRVCIVEDQYGFILNHMVMEKETDDKVAVPITKGTLNLFPQIQSCSYDKGFYSPANRESLDEILEKAIMPKKGKLSQKDKEIEYDSEFIRLRNKHAAVESCINALENHGLDRCPDNGKVGFKRYVALGILARNIQILGAKLFQQEKAKQEKAA